MEEKRNAGIEQARDGEERRYSNGVPQSFTPLRGTVSVTVQAWDLPGTDRERRSSNMEKFPVPT